MAPGGQKNPVAGVPEVVARGQGALPDVMVPRDSGVSREVWRSYAAPLSGGSAIGPGARRAVGRRHGPLGGETVVAGGRVPG